MPTYDYKCLKCGHVFEVFHKITESPEIKCPVCGGPVKKLLSSGAGILFKGSGFHITDYKKSSPNLSSNSSSSSSSETSKSDSFKSKESAQKT